MSPKPTKKPPIPTAFTAKKNDILASLATPDVNYTDASPKGSIDVRIRGLIDRINGLEGVVTTSSCSGRISVFLEGTKGHVGKVGEANGVENEGFDEVTYQVDSLVGKSNAETEITEKYASKQVPQRAVPGGKGNGGRWLFVSHDPLPEDFLRAEASLFRTLGLDPGADAGRVLQTSIGFAGPGKPRLIRFQFEPMVRR